MVNAHPLDAASSAPSRRRPIAMESNDGKSKMSQPFSPVTIALNKINAEIGNRQTVLRELNEKRMRLEGEISGLREAQNHFEAAQHASPPRHGE